MFPWRTTSEPRNGRASSGSRRGVRPAARTPQSAITPDAAARGGSRKAMRKRVRERKPAATALRHGPAERPRKNPVSRGMERHRGKPRFWNGCLMPLALQPPFRDRNPGARQTFEENSNRFSGSILFHASCRTNENVTGNSPEQEVVAQRAGQAFAPAPPVSFRARRTRW